MSNPWKTLTSKVVYTNRWITLLENSVIRPDGSTGIYTVIEAKPSTHIVALTDKQEVHLIAQFRYTTNTLSWELPAGSVETEDLLSAAQRELSEETGLQADNWQEIGKFHTMNGISGQMSHVFVARELSHTEKGRQSEEGISQAKAVPFFKVFDLIGRGEITDSDTICALTIAAIRLGYLDSGDHSR